MKRINTFTKTIGLGILLLISLNSWAQTSIPKNLTLTYNFELISIPLGQIEKRLSHNGGIYTADSKIKPNAAAAMIYSGEITEKSRFKIEDNRLVPLSFHAIRKSSKPYDRKATFDQNNNTVSYNSGTSEKLRDNTFDLGSFPFAFMLENLGEIENKVYNINTGDKYTAYVVLKPLQEKIKTPAGSFNTTKITLKRQDRDNRFYHVWLDNKSQYPVKIVRDKKGKISSLIMTSARS